MRESVERASVDAFGEAPQKAVLAQLVASIEREDPDTAWDALGRGRTERSPAPSPRPPMPANETLASASATAASAPVATPTPAARLASRSPVLKLVGAGALVVAAALGIRAMIDGHPLGVAAAGAPSAVATAPVASEPPVVPSVPRLAASAAEPASPPAVVSAPTLPRTTPVPPVPPASRPRLAASAGAVGALGAAPRPGCDPDFTYDANGNKIFKPQCFGP
jgi:hypothetical protein